MGKKEQNLNLKYGKVGEDDENSLDYFMNFLADISGAKYGNGILDVRETEYWKQQNSK